MDRIAEFLQEGDGNFSATRLGFLVWVVGVLVAWVASSLFAKALQPIPESVVAILGVLMTGKVAQKGMEPDTSTPNGPSPNGGANPPSSR